MSRPKRTERANSKEVEVCERMDLSISFLHTRPRMQEQPERVSGCSIPDSKNVVNYELTAVPGIPARLPIPGWHACALCPNGSRLCCRFYRRRDGTEPRSKWDS